MQQLEALGAGSTGGAGLTRRSRPPGRLRFSSADQAEAIVPLRGYETMLHPPFLRFSLWNLNAPRSPDKQLGFLRQATVENLVTPSPKNISRVFPQDLR